MSVVDVKKIFKAACFSLLYLNRINGKPDSKSKKNAKPETKIIDRILEGIPSK